MPHRCRHRLKNDPQAVLGVFLYCRQRRFDQMCRFRCDQGTPDECAGQFTIGTGRYGPVPQWHGIFADKDDFYSHLRKAGFLFHSEADEIGDAEILALWDIEKKKTAERKKKSS